MHYAVPVLRCYRPLCMQIQRKINHASLLLQLNGRRNWYPTHMPSSRVIQCTSRNIVASLSLVDARIMLCLKTPLGILMTSQFLLFKGLWYALEKILRANWWRSSALFMTLPQPTLAGKLLVFLWTQLNHSKVSLSEGRWNVPVSWSPDKSSSPAASDRLSLTAAYSTDTSLQKYRHGSICKTS